MDNTLKSSIIIGASATAATATAQTIGLTASGGAVLAGGAGAILSTVALPALFVGLVIASGYTILSTWDEVEEYVSSIDFPWEINEQENGVTKNPEVRGFGYLPTEDSSYLYTPWANFRIAANAIWRAIKGYTPTTTEIANTIAPVTGVKFLSDLEEWLNSASPSPNAVSDWEAIKASDSYTKLLTWIDDKVGFWSVNYIAASQMYTFLFYSLAEYTGDKKPLLPSHLADKGSYDAYYVSPTAYNYWSQGSSMYTNMFTTYGGGIKFRYGVIISTDIIESSDPYDFVYSSNGVYKEDTIINMEKQDGVSVDILDYLNAYGQMTDEKFEEFTAALEGLGAKVDGLEGAITDNEGIAEKVDSVALALAAAGVIAGTQEDVLTGVTPVDVVIPAINAGGKVATGAAEATGATDPDNSGGTPTIILPVDRGGLDIFTVYNPTDAQIKQFGQWLWAGILENIFDALKKLYQNPFDAIIGLSEIYVIPTDLTSGTIQLGKIDSEISSSIVNNKYVSLKWQPLKIPETYYNVYDYDYTTISIFLPFIGIVPLDTADIMGKTVQLSATADVSTGMIVYNIVIIDGYSNVSQLQYIFSGNCSVQKPITGANYNSIINGLLGVAGGIAGAVATGGVGGAAIAGMAAKGTAGAISQGVSIKQSGSIGANFGAMTTKTPYILVTHKTPFDPAVFNNYYGYPSNNNVLLSECKGYTRVKSIELTGIEGTLDEITEIERLLKEGVYI